MAWAVRKILAPLLAASALLAGCASHSTQQAGDLSPYRRIYVEHRLNDNHRLDELIVGELEALGYKASSGPLTMLPEGVDAIITYQARWAWDFKSYLIEFSLEMHRNFTGKPLATGHYHQASAYTKPPAEVVHEIVAPLFKRRVAKP